MMLDPSSLFRGKNITVMGLGLLGRGLGDTLFLVDCGARVTVTDLKTADQLRHSVERLKGLPVKLRLGGHDPEDFASSDMILRNADVPRSSPFLKIAANNSIPIEMDESLFCKHFNGRIVGITGTRGKTTTTTLVHRILQHDGTAVHLAGNIMGTATLPLLDKAGSGDTVVLELSSWQLQGFHDARISPHMSLFTNIFPDHLNRYAGMEEYIHDKKAIYLYQKQGDICLFNLDQPESAGLADEAPAGAEFFSTDQLPGDWKIKLPGKHNLANIAAAARMCGLLGVSPSVIRSAVEDFKGIEHRLQYVGEKDGIQFVNDSTSTTPIAGCAALESFDGKRILLIAGGADKKLDLTPFATAAAKRTTAIALLEGEATEALYAGILDASGESKIVGRFTDLKAAVHGLLEGARSGDVILLSPGCASFGMFRNEFDRGTQFMEIARHIIR